MKFIKQLLLATTLLFPLMNANVLHASTFNAAENNTINEPVHDDLYVAGSNVVINAPIYGDLIAAGQNITVKDTIYGDLIAAGQDIEMQGVVVDDIRIAGADVTISGYVGSDLIAAGADILVEEGVIVNGDLTLSGADLTMNGTVHGKTSMSGGKIFFNGEAKGLVNVDGHEVTMNGLVTGKSRLISGTIDLESNAEFKDDIMYWNSTGKVDFSQVQTGGTATYSKDLASVDDFFSWEHLGIGIVMLIILYLLSMGVVLVILVFLANPLFERIASAYSGNFGKSLGYGVVYLVGVPIVVMMLFVTVIGIPVALVATSLYVISVLFVNSFLAVSITNLINQHYQMQWKKGILFLVSLGILVLLKLISFIPVIGWLIMFLASAVFFGALFLGLRAKPGELANA